MATQVKDDRPVKFTTFAWIGSTELRGCSRCGATILRSSVRNGELMEIVHRKWHEEISEEQQR